VVIDGGSAGLGNGSAGIAYYCEDSGLSNVTVENTRVMRVDRAFKFDATPGGYIAACHLNNCDAWVCKYGVHETNGSNGGDIKGNYYNLNIQFRSEFVNGYYIEGRRSTIEDLSFDPSKAQGRPMVVTGRHNLLIEREGRIDLNRRAELNGAYTTIVDTRSTRTEYPVGVPDAPSWAVTNDNGDGNLNWAFSTGIARLKANPDTTTPLRVTANIPLFEPAENPDLSVDIQLQPSPTNVRALFGFETEAGGRILFAADPTNATGASVTSNFVAIVDDPDGTTSSYDTGVALDDSSHRIAVRMLDQSTAVHFVMGNERVASHTASARFDRMSPLFEIESLTSDDRLLRLIQPFAVRSSR
jgi:hypothetical protein